jgi:hypothetical protein
MLYDPKWEAKSEPLSLEGLISWLEKQPADQRYNFFDCEGECLFGQYMRAIGYTWDQSQNQPAGTPIEVFETLVYDSCACQQPMTFGAALDRARSYSRT